MMRLTTILTVLVSPIISIGIVYFWHGIIAENALALPLILLTATIVALIDIRAKIRNLGFTDNFVLRTYNFIFDQNIMVTDNSFKESWRKSSANEKRNRLSLSLPAKLKLDISPIVSTVLHYVVFLYALVYSSTSTLLLVIAFYSIATPIIVSILVSTVIYLGVNREAVK